MHMEEPLENFKQIKVGNLHNFGYQKQFIKKRKEMSPISAKVRQETTVPMKYISESPQLAMNCSLDKIYM